MKKKLTVVAALVLVLAMGVGGTLAYLTSTSDTITNTFTVGNVSISLAETKGTGEGNDKTFKMIPGNEIEKDPKVTVNAGSEACWLFVKLDKSVTVKKGDYTFDSYVTYSMADGWTALSDVDGVYYREQADLSGSGATKAEYSVLKGDKVEISEDVTTDMLNVITENPKMKITAYAVQKANVDSAAAAWAVLNPST